MIDHPCHRCPLVFKTKKDLEQHLAKKYPCDKAPFRCECGHGFQRANALAAHKRNSCKGPQNSITSLEHRVQQLEQTLANVSPCPQQSISNNESVVVNNTNNTINNVNVNVTNNYTVVMFGNEHLSHIRNFDIPDLKKRLGNLDPGVESVRKFVEMERFDPDLPENRNVLMFDEDRLLILTANGWKDFDADRCMVEVFRNSIKNLDKVTHLPPYTSRQDAELTAYNEQFVVPLMAQLVYKDKEGTSAEVKPFVDAIRNDLMKWTNKIYGRSHQPSCERLYTKDEMVKTFAALLDGVPLQLPASAPRTSAFPHPSDPGFVCERGDLTELAAVHDG